MGNISTKRESEGSRLLMLENEGIPSTSNSQAKTGGKIEEGITKELSLIPVGWPMKRIPENKFGNVGGSMFTNLY